PDLVISGVNRGHNIAEDAVYSGTVAGAKEAAMQGVKAVAFSQYYSAEPEAPEDAFAPSRALGAETVRRLLAMPWRSDLFYNVNFPARRPEAVEGFAVAPQGRRIGGAFRIEAARSPTHRDYLWLAHAGGNKRAAPGSDATLCADGWITVTPMRPDLTDEAMMEEARAALAAGAEAAQ
ncbi:MAG: 5'/3'-nucleotidase SurE, partial [Pseudomonadota bacterium]